MSSDEVHVRPENEMPGCLLPEGRQGSRPESAAGPATPGRVPLEEVPLHVLCPGRRAAAGGLDAPGSPPGPPCAKVVGVGGGGIRAVGHMLEAGIHGVEFVAVDADATAVKLSAAPRRVHIGERECRGMGAGGNAVVGQKAAEESAVALREALRGAYIVLIAAGMGGGIGGGAAPVVARIAREAGALTLAVVTEPFTFEGQRRQILAAQGIEALRKSAAATIVIPSDRLLPFATSKRPASQVFAIADDVMYRCVQAIAEILTLPGLIQLDAIDLSAVLKGANSAGIGIGEASGNGYAREAARRALHSLSLVSGIAQASSILIHVCGGPDLLLHEAGEIVETLTQDIHPDANIIFGVAVSPSLQKEVRVTIVATLPE